MGKKIFVRTCNQGAHSEDMPSSAQRIFVRPCHRGTQSEAMPLSAHSKAIPSRAYYDQPRSLNNKMFVEDNIT